MTTTPGSTAKTAIGINFGDSFSSIAVINNNGQAECIANEDGERQIASAISFSGQEVHIGNGARPQLVKNAKNTITNFRNILGKKYADVTSNSRNLAIESAPIVQGADDLPAFVVDVLVPQTVSAPGSVQPTPISTPRPASPIPSQQTLTVPEVTTEYLKSLKQSAIDFLGKPIDAAVISIPSWFDENARSSLFAAAKAADLNVIQLLEETGCVASAYIDYDALPANQSDKLKSDKKTLLVDLGASSLHLSLLSINQGLAHPIAESYDNTVGGDAIDTLLINHFGKEFTKKTKIPLDFSKDKRSEVKMRLAVEHTKRTLSASTGPAPFAVESLKDGYDTSGSITRMRFDLLVAPVYKKVSEGIKDVLSKAGLDAVQLDEILLVGASARLPGLAEEIQNNVIAADPEDSETLIRQDIESFEVIARGAALQARMLTEMTEEEAAAGAFTPGSGLTKVQSVSKPILLVFPAAEGANPSFPIVQSETPLPLRRIARFEVDSATAPKIGLELWESKDTVKVTKVEAEKVEGDDDEEELEPEETRERIYEPETQLGGLQYELLGSGKAKVLVQVDIAVNGTIDVKVYEESSPEKAQTLSIAGSP